MKINSIRYAENDYNVKPIAFELDTSDLTGEEYAELRFLVDQSRITDGKKRNKPANKNKPGVLIAVETDDGTREAFFDSELADEILEFCEFLKDLQASHVPVISRGS